MNGFNAVALTTGDYSMSVITPLNSERRIGSFFGGDQSDAMNRPDVSLLSSFVMLEL